MAKPYRKLEDRGPFGRTSGRPPKYPWALWMNGSVHVVERGIDFTTTISGFRGMLSGRAKCEGLICHTSADGDTLTFQFTVDTRKR